MTVIQARSLRIRNQMLQEKDLLEDEQLTGLTCSKCANIRVMKLKIIRLITVNTRLGEIKCKSTLNT